MGWGARGVGVGPGGKLCLIKPYAFNDLNSVNKNRFDYTTLAINFASFYIRSRDSLISDYRLKTLMRSKHIKG